MKTSLLALTCLAATLVFAGCDEKATPPADNQPAPTRIYSFSMEVDSYPGAGDSWVDGSRREMSFDSEGRLTAKQEAWFMGSWMNTNRFEYEYDSRSRVVRETELVDSSGNWVPNRKYEYVWNNDLLVSGLGYKYIGDQWMEIWSRTITRDFEGRMTQDIVDDYSGDCVDGVPRTGYSWNQDGRLSRREAYYTPKGGVEAGNWARDFSYDLLGRLSEEIESYASGSTWMPNNRHVWAWDLENNPVSATTYSYSGGIWTPTGRRSDTLDDQKRHIETVDENRSGGVWVLVSKIVNDWDEQGAQSLCTNYSRSGGAWVADYKWTRTVVQVPSGVKLPSDQLNAPSAVDLYNWGLYGDAANISSK